MPQIYVLVQGLGEEQNEGLLIHIQVGQGLEQDLVGGVQLEVGCLHYYGEFLLECLREFVERFL